MLHGAKNRFSIALVAGAAAALLAFPEPLAAGAHSPRVVSEHVPDAFSLADYRKYPAWKDLSGQDLALAVWKAFVGTETGVAHFQPIREGPDPVDWEFRLIRDPIKMLNVYGYGFCGAFGPTTAGLFEAMGFEQVRSAGIPGLNHSVTEVWYDGAWHYFDTDVRGVIFRRDGRTIASIEEAREQLELWANPSKKITPFFPDVRDLGGFGRKFAERPAHYSYNWHMSGSTMDFRLRKGESLTRWWRPQGGRWSHQEEDAETEFFRNLILKPPYGAKTNHPSFTIWTHGNGLFEYAPNLRKGSADFEDGAFSRRNVELSDRGLTLAGDGEGEAVFEVLSPYVIVPRVGDLDDRSDDKEASVVTFSSQGRVTASISLDFGRTFRELKIVPDGGITTLDLTPHLRERYQYLIRFTLEGKKRQTLLSSLDIRTWVQIAPISLPRLRKGLNRLEFKTRDQHGFASTPWMQIPNMGDREEMGRYWTQPPANYDPGRKLERLKGAMEVAFHAPPGRKIRWASIGGFFRSHHRQEAPRSANEMWVAAGPAGEWKRIYRAAVPAWHNHWHYAQDKEIMLEAPAESLRVRYVGDPAVNGVRVNLHSVKPGAAQDDPVTVTHSFTLEGKNVTRKFTFRAPQRYTIDCPAEPEDVFVRLEIPSDKRPD
jgi:hypothetical protein